MKAAQPIPFCDLRAAHAARAPAVEQALLRVASSGRYVLGPEVAAFESEWADFCGIAHAVGVGNGTDAIALALRAAGVGPGDEVLVPAFTAPPTWIAVSCTGATPVGVDVEKGSGLVDPEQAAAAVGPRTRALVAVHLFGRLAPMRALRALADGHGLVLIEDAAHAPGAHEEGIGVGALGDAAAFSFYPTKPLGALGDAGAVATGSQRLADGVRALRSYGQGWPPGDALAGGVNSRLDELQAAVLRARLAGLQGDLARLRALAAHIRRGLEGISGLGLPPLPPSGREPAWHQFWVVHEQRERLREQLARQGVGSAVHYRPIPPQLTPFRDERRFPVAAALARRILSLPFDPWLSEAQLDTVCAATRRAISSLSST